MKRFLLFIFLTISSTKFFAQQDKNFLVIPPEPKLYISSADRDISARTGASYAQIREAFRRGLVKEIEQEFSKMGTTTVLLADSGEVYEDMRYVYHNVGYKYDVVPSEETMVKDFQKAKKLIDKIIPKEETAEVKTAEVEHFMNTSIHNPNLLEYLATNYNVNHFIFINQLDIKDEPSSAYDYGTEDLDRVVRVHFTIMDVTGKVIYAGLAKKEFPAKYSTPDVIMRYTFPTISKFIYKKIEILEAPEAKIPEDK